MSAYLPYDSGGTARWVTAGGLAILAHGLAIAGACVGLHAAFGAMHEPEQRPAFAITLQQLDTDALKGVHDVPADARTTLEPQDPPPQVTPPQEVGTGAEIAALSPQAPEDPALTAPLKALAPIPPTPKAAIPDPPSEIAPSTPPPPMLAATPIRPELVSPIMPEIGAGGAGGLSPPGPDGSTIPPQGGRGPDAVPAPGPPPMRPVPSGTSLASTASAPTTATPAAFRPAPPPSPQDLALGDLIRRIRTTPAAPCLITLPRRDGPEAVGLGLIASRGRAMSTFSDALLTPEDTTIRQTRALVDTRQCPALGFLRALDDYPATRLGLSLDSDEVPSGGRLSGLIGGVAGRNLLLLLIDNNGVVQDLQRFVSFSGNYARFDVPVTRAGAARDTSQLLLALATDRPATRLRERIGQRAQQVFAGDPGTALAGAAFALRTFDVR